MEGPAASAHARSERFPGRASPPLSDGSQEPRRAPRPREAVPPRQPRLQPARAAVACDPALPRSGRAPSVRAPASADRSARQRGFEDRARDRSRLLLSDFAPKSSQGTRQTRLDRAEAPPEGLGGLTL